MTRIPISIVASLLALALLLQGCGPRVESYYEMEIKNVGGRPYLLLQTYPISGENGEQPYFGIFTPRGTSAEDWQPVVTDLRGPCDGTFIARKENAEQLGLFHMRRTTVLDLATQPPQVNPDTLQFDWPAETSVDFKGATCAFGMKPDETDTTKFAGRLRAAKFDGQQWTELPSEGPLISVPQGFAGFTLQSEVYKDAVKIFWRDLKQDQALDQEIEGWRSTAEGPLCMATFDGEKFTDTAVSIENLPRGNTCIWSDADGIHVLVQTRKKLEEGVSANGPMEIWHISSDGVATQTDVIPDTQPKAGLLPFIAAVHFTLEGQEYILRSNWQMFEVWQKDAGGWRFLSRNPKGLPVYDLENVMLTGLAIGLTLIVFGAGLAYRRRMHAWTVVRKIRASEFYASLGLRMGAYAIDLSLILTAAVMIEHSLHLPYETPLRMLEVTLTHLDLQFFAAYLVYFTLSEWRFGTTIGKFVMGLCVVMDNGAPLSFSAAAVRNFVGFFERLPQVVPLVSMPMILLGPRRQRLGDILSRTYVVQKGALEIFKAQRAEQARLREAGDALGLDSSKKLSMSNTLKSEAAEEKDKRK